MMRRLQGLCQLLLLLAGIGLLFSGCGVEQGSGEGDCILYYLSADGTELVKESGNIGDGPISGQIDRMLELLEKEEEDAEYKSVFVDDVQVQDWKMEGTELALYFNEEYRKLSPSSELLLRAAVVQSVVQIPGVSYVIFYVGDRPLTGQDGQELGYMNADSFVQNTGSSLHTYQTAELTLYFSNHKGDKLAAEKRSTRYNSNKSVERLTVEKLLEGPENPAERPVIPSGTKLLGVSTRDEVCYVNFDEGFLNVADQVNPKVTIYALVNSIIDSGGCRQVQILVNGETNVVYQESIDLSRTFSRSADMIETEEN